MKTRLSPSKESICLRSLTQEGLPNRDKILNPFFKEPEGPGLEQVGITLSLLFSRTQILKTN